MNEQTLAKTLTLLQYAERFLAERDVSEVYKMQIRSRCQKLCEWAGRILQINELTCALVNEWLASLGDELAAYTKNTYRANLLAVWNAAYVDELNDNPPLRVRKIKRPRLIVEAYTLGEIQQLLHGCARLKGYDHYGNRRADFWSAAIHGAYATGLRRSDVLNVPKCKVAKDGLFTTIQRKTGYRITVQFSHETLQFAEKLRSPENLLIPWPYRLDAFVPAFRRVMRASDVERGSFRWLRRSAGSYAESVQPGSGSRLLGHRNESVFRNHYEDQGISAPKPFSPPAIPAVEGT